MTKFRWLAILLTFVAMILYSVIYNDNEGVMYGMIFLAVLWAFDIQALNDSWDELRRYEELVGPIDDLEELVEEELAVNSDDNVSDALSKIHVAIATKNRTSKLE